MDAWTAAIDSYCERTGPEFWSEPLNALSNAAFLIGALVAWTVARRAKRTGDWAVVVLTLALAVIGIGSFLFHTFATRWAATADVLPIMVFILLYLHVAVVRYLDLPWWAGIVAVVAFLPASAVVGAWLDPVLGSLNGSIGYVPTLLLLALFAAGLAVGGRPAWRGLAGAAALLAVSLTFRTLDAQGGPLCGRFPAGTHWGWHLLNGALLSVLIVTLVRHGAPRVARPRGAG